MHRFVIFFRFCIAVALVMPARPQIVHAQVPDRKPMTFMDVLRVRTIGQTEPSPDGRWLLYTLSELNWGENKRTSDLHLVHLKEGLKTGRRLTWTTNANEESPAWSPDSRWFGFLSDRKGPTGEAVKQLYVMARDGGEARRISNVPDGVQRFQFSRDGRSVAFSGGKEQEAALWILPLSALDTASPRKLLPSDTPVFWWSFSEDSRRIFVLTPDSVDSANRKRNEKKFDVRIRNEIHPPVHLWSVDVETGVGTRLTSGSAYSVQSVTQSRDGRWIGFRGIPNDRYQRTVSEAAVYGDLYLLDLTTGDLERLTENEVAESSLSFSPSGLMMAFSASDGFGYFRTSRIFVRRVADRNGQWKTLGKDFAYDCSVGFWSDDEREIFFDAGIGATEQICAADVASGTVRQITRDEAVHSVFRDDISGTLLVRRSDASTPADVYRVASVRELASPQRWLRLTDANPAVRSFALGETRVLRWRSTDGETVEGIVITPPGFREGTRCPLIVQIHGGPAAAVTVGFNASYGYYSHVFAGAGYVCLLPNYRGSSNYGEAFRMQIAGDYFRQGYDDIMTGVDELIRRGLVDSTMMGVMGWSAGGHWSNWILTRTERFKAISSGAGAVNWISMYAQTDMQRVREFYFGGVPYGRTEAFWDVSPLKYIEQARTPTLIHVVDGDPRVPRPQSEELHMALRKLGVPTEFLVYPGSAHGISSPRYQLVKMASEFGWMERWLRGKEPWLDWNEILRTLEHDSGQSPPGAAAEDGDRPRLQ